MRLNNYLLFGCLITTTFACTSVEPGYVGVRERMSQVQPDHIEPGWRGFIPFVDKIHKVKVKVVKQSVEVSSTTQDQQIVTTQAVLNWRPDPNSAPAHYETYNNLGEDVVRHQFIASVKTVMGKYQAPALVAQREILVDDIKLDLMNKMAPIGVIVEGISIANFDFSEEYDSAIEAKQAAEQKSQQAAIELKTAKAEAAQTVARAEGKKAAILLEAEAEAKALEIKGEVLRANPGLVSLIEAERWDGKRSKTSVVVGSTDAGVLLDVPTE